MKRTAFTLIEILIVVILLGILAAIVVPQITGSAADAALTAADTDVSMLNTQYQLWRFHNGGVAEPADYAAAITAMTAANADGSPSVLQAAPTPPTGYQYNFAAGVFSHAAAE